MAELTMGSALQGATAGQGVAGRGAAPAAPPATLPFRTRFGYGIGDFATNIYWNASNLFLLFFYTEVLGISAATAGLIYLVALVWDAVADPIVGVLAQRVDTRWGRYRPFLFLGTVPLVGSYVLAFTDPGLEGWALVGYALATHLLFRTVFTAVSIPYISLSTRITQSSVERAVLTGYRVFFAMIGSLLIASLMLPMVDLLGGEDQARGFLLAALLSGTAGGAVLLLCAGLTREPPGVVSAGDEAAPSVARFVRMVRENRPFQIVLGAFFFTTLGNTIFGAAALYYFKYVLAAEGATPIALALVWGGAVFGAPFWSFMVGRIGRRRVWQIGFAIASVGLGALWLLASTDALTSVLVAFFVTGFGASMSGVILWSALPDTVEYGEWRSGVRSESMLIGLTVFWQKVAVGVGTFLFATALGLVGYAPEAAPSRATLEGLRVLQIAVPFVISAVALALFSFYRLEADEHARIVGELDARRAA